MRRQQGFTILEVLVGFLLSALLLSMILSGFSSGMTGLARTDNLSKAALVAQSRLFEVGVTIPLAPGTYQGSDPAGFRWQVDIQPLDWAYAAPLQEQNAALYNVVAHVAWQMGSGGSFELASLRYAQLERQQ